jgi:hypothetical protein
VGDVVEWYAIEIVVCSFADVNRTIAVADGWGGYDHSGVYSPHEMLTRQWHTHLVKGGKHSWELEPPGWFDRQCDRLDCPWFPAFVRRMAVGEVVSIKEIQDTYRIHNHGRPIPTGTWDQLCVVWYEMAEKP